MKGVITLSAVVLSAALAGCATGRSVLDAGIDAGRNPAQGTTVRIESVQDARVFSVRPPSADMPSLMDDQINNRALTSRAVGRKRGGFGAALGDVLLPEGSTVAGLVQSAVTRGMRDAGYRVLDRGEAGYEQAAPVTVRVEQFWSWFAPGAFSVTLTNRGGVNMQGPIAPLAQGRTFSSQATEGMQAVVDSDWLAIVNKGLDALARAVRDGLR
jgi:hypothetical protein